MQWYPETAAPRDRADPVDTIFQSGRFEVIAGSAPGLTCASASVPEDRQLAKSAI